MGSYFGALPVHGALWDSAEDTKHSLISRLSIIHLGKFYHLMYL